MADEDVVVFTDPNDFCAAVDADIAQRDVEIQSLRAQVGRMREALERIADGDEPRPLGEQWRNDGKPSKNDKCIHGRWMYDDCGQCVAEFARAALTPSAPEQAHHE